MARKNLPWQAEFSREDRNLIIKWIEEHLSSADRWGRPLANLGSPARLTIHRSGRDTPPVVCNVRPGLDPSRARRILRELGFDKDFIDSYSSALRVSHAGRPEDVFANMWLNLSEAGAAVHLREILTADKENAHRWKAYLKKEGKTWGDVRISATAKAKIVEAIIQGFNLPSKHWDALRQQFCEYTKRYLRSPIDE